MFFKSPSQSYFMLIKYLRDYIHALGTGNGRIRFIFKVMYLTTIVAPCCTLQLRFQCCMILDSTGDICPQILPLGMGWMFLQDMVWLIWVLRAVVASGTSFTFLYVVVELPSCTYSFNRPNRYWSTTVWLGRRGVSCFIVSKCSSEIPDLQDILALESGRSAIRTGFTMLKIGG